MQKTKPDHMRPDAFSETEYISPTLSAVRQWTSVFEVHVWIIAYAMNLQKQKDGNHPVSTPYDISGSAH